ncbi:hypothetical protein CCR85_12295 [Rhodothalassium salexigens]|uniref:RsmB/NOP family class I SAM-dependent RNA methyltransferase n=1 Tax=Rhodothalassium salexigens TaxID=1086 RepID=UPI0019122CC9|nr:transcription antitermination factor NusB [Rhodothalassium salexigens]MBK5912270.1 hypothetical protein [Rhodothalassium salexigens]
MTAASSNASRPTGPTGPAGADRRAALAILTEVIDRGRPLDAAVDAAFSGAGAALPVRDRAFARALATAALRHRGGLTRLVGALLDRPPKGRARQMLPLLHLGLAQIFHMNVADHAAVSATVALAPKPYRGLVNAVLRRAVRDRARLASLLAADGVDLPAWLFARWQKTYGAETAAAMARAMAVEPPLDLTARHDPAALAQATDGRLLATGSVRLVRPPAVDTLPGFDQGAFWVQDAAAALPVALLGDVAGRRVADLCAAPGGKTLQLAARGARVTAVDRSAERLATVRANLDRCGLDARIVAADLTEWTPDAPFDAILLDAPCTATGTLRRHPDVAWHRGAADVAKLAALQRRLAARAAGWLAPGGRLVFSTCSLEPEEGPAVARHLIETCDDLAPQPLGDPAAEAARLAPDAPEGLAAALAGFADAEGWLRTRPDQWAEVGGLDGFFAARFVKRG